MTFFNRVNAAGEKYLLSSYWRISGYSKKFLNQNSKNSFFVRNSCRKKAYFSHAWRKKKFRILIGLFSSSAASLLILKVLGLERRRKEQRMMMIFFFKIYSSRPSANWVCKVSRKKASREISKEKKKKNNLRFVRFLSLVEGTLRGWEGVGC